MGLDSLKWMALALPGFTATAAFAQEAPVPPVTPLNAPIGAPRDADRSDDPRAIQPVGAHFGSFTLFPKLEVAPFYDDNIYALETKTDDVVLRVSPIANLKGDFGRDKLTLYGGLDRLDYKDNTSESRTDWRLRGSNSYELAEKTLFVLGAGYLRDHEDRGDPNSLTTNLHPTLFYRTDANIGVSRDLASLRAGFRATYRHYNYYDAEQVGGGITNNDDRDRSEYLGEGRLGYLFSPGYSAVVRLQYQRINYRLPLDDTGRDRSSKNLKALAGIKFELSRLLEGEVTAGYLHRTYSDIGFRNTNRFTFDANLKWFATELTSFELLANRSAVESVAAGYSSYIANSFVVRAEHELLRTVKINATLRYISNDYNRAITTAPIRKEKFYGASAGVRYDLNRNFYLVGGYDWNKKTSTATNAGSEFTRNRLSLTAGAQF